MAIVITLILAFIVAYLKFIVEGFCCDPNVKNKVEVFFLLWGFYTIIIYPMCEYAFKLMHQLARELSGI